MSRVPLQSRCSRCRQRVEAVAPSRVRSGRRRSRRAGSLRQGRALEAPACLRRANRRPFIMAVERLDPMRFFALLILVGALGAAGAQTSVTVQPSSIGFRQALAACPSSALAAISLTLGHVRISEAPDVDSDIDSTNPNAQTVTLTSGSRTATATVNASKNTVSAKHVTLASAKRVACVAPD